jgi:type III secretory pathway component EscV
MRPHARITVELGPAAAPARTTKALVETAPDDGVPLGELIRAALQDWLDEMSLPAVAMVELTAVDAARGPRFVDLAVILNGVRCGFSKRQLAQVYESSTQREAASFEAAKKAARDLLADSAAQKGESRALAQAFLAELVVEAVKASAEQVITPEVLQALLARALEESAAVRAAVEGMDQGLATEVLRRLTGVHVSVKDAPAFVRSVFRGPAEGLTAADLAEGLVNQWRADTVEIRVDMALAKSLLKVHPVAGTAYAAAELAQEPADLLGMMCDGLFYELGLWFAKITLIPDPKLPANCCRFRLHQQLSPVLRGLGGDELLVNETCERVTAAGIPARRPRANPANGNPCAVISQLHRHLLRPEWTTWDQFGYLVLLLASELRAAAATLLSLDHVDDLLGKLDSAFPVLVAATRRQYTLLQVAQVLRWLLHNGLSIRDLRTILELMLDFSYATGVRSPTAGWGGRESYVYVGDAEFTGEPYFTADDPYVPQFDLDRLQLFAEPTAEWRANGRVLAEFVKCGLRHFVTHKLTRGQNTLICYLLDAEIEKRLLAFRAAPAAENFPFREQELAEILKGMEEEFAEDFGSPNLFLATTPDVALLVQDMIGQDFPDVNVLHRQSIEESVNVQPIGRVPNRGSRRAAR